MAVPTLIQHVHGPSNDGQENGNTFKFNLPDPLPSGASIIIGANYNFSAGRTVTITDDKSNTYTNRVSTNDGGCTTTIFDSLQAAANTQAIQVVFDAAIENVLFVVSVFYNLATTTDGTSAAANLTGPTISSGAIVTTTDGDLIYNFGVDSNGGFPASSNAATSFSPGVSFTRLSMRRDPNNILSWAQYQVQGTHGSINPTMTVNQAVHDTQFSSVSVAYKSAAAGSDLPAGIHVRHIYHMPFSVSPTTVDFPSSGNLIVMSVADQMANESLTSVTDSNSNSYTTHRAAGTAQFSSTDSGATTGNALTVTITMGTPSGAFNFLYDISGAAASPFDVFAGSSGNTSGGSPNNTGNAPSITPTTSNGIVIGCSGITTGPATSVNSSFIFDAVTYVGETDTGNNDSADAFSHFYNPNTNTLNIVYTLTNGGVVSGYNAGAVAYKAAPTSSPPMSWYLALSEPIRFAKPNQDWIAAPVFVPPAPPFGWFDEWVMPRAANAIRRQDEISKPVFVPPSPSYAWFYPWSEPIRFTKGNQDYFAYPLFTPAAAPVPPMSWYLAFSEPIRWQKPNTDWFTEPVFVQPAPSYGWYMPMQEPVRPGRNINFITNETHDMLAIAPPAPPVTVGRSVRLGFMTPKFR